MARLDRWLVLGLVAISLAACSSSKQPPPGAKCTVNSDCNNPLSCTFGVCHQTCREARDCPTGERCVSAPMGAVCQLNAQCIYRSDCPQPLACALDRQCRSQCIEDRDCPTHTQKCVKPEGVCAEPDEIDAATGKLKQAQDTPVYDGPDSGTAPADAGSADASPDVAPAPDAAADLPLASDLSAPTDTAPDVAPDAPGDLAPDLGPGQTCNDKMVDGDETGLDCGGSCPPCPMEANWATKVDTYRGMMGKQVTLHCGPMGTSGSIWGTDTYTDDSSVCTAAVHSSLITFAGGTVTIEIRPGQASYVGSKRNNITSGSFGSWDGSFVFVPLKVPNCGNLMKDGDETDVDCGGKSCQPCGGGRLCQSDADCDGTTCAGRCAMTADWTTNATAFRGMNGARIPFLCPTQGIAASIWGTDVYTDDSPVCTAGVHAGKITLANGGTVIIEIRPAQGSYVGSIRNGITSNDYGGFMGSYAVP